MASTALSLPTESPTALPETPEVLAKPVYLPTASEHPSLPRVGGRLAHDDR